MNVLLVAEDELPMLKQTAILKLSRGHSNQRVKGMKCL